MMREQVEYTSEQKNGRGKERLVLSYSQHAYNRLSLPELFCYVVNSRVRAKILSVSEKTGDACAVPSRMAQSKKIFLEICTRVQWHNLLIFINHMGHIDYDIQCSAL